mgnify:CR=1 FL=1
MSVCVFVCINMCTFLYIHVCEGLHEHVYMSVHLFVWCGSGERGREMALYVQVGQCGNQVAGSLWDAILQELRYDKQRKKCAVFLFLHTCRRTEHDAATRQECVCMSVCARARVCVRVCVCVNALLCVCVYLSCTCIQVCVCLCVFIACCVHIPVGQDMAQTSLLAAGWPYSHCPLGQ